MPVDGVAIAPCDALPIVPEFAAQPWTKESANGEPESVLLEARRRALASVDRVEEDLVAEGDVLEGQRLETIDALKPGLLHGEGDEDFRYLLMPVRL